MNIVRDLLDKKLHNNDIHIIDNIMGFLTDKCSNCDQAQFVEDLYTEWHLCSDCCSHLKKYIKYFEKCIKLTERKTEIIIKQNDLMRQQNLNMIRNVDIELHIELECKIRECNKEILSVEKDLKICENITEHIKNNFLIKVPVEND